ncbi:MAG: hypothetical protein GF329_10790 [Candidatus Lokiarchaeota archaeon]|nr:hypothetical protein [Candidatus Lokiarchaeota archaeon]
MQSKISSIKLHEISELIWEGHHFDFTNSLLNPIYEYQAVFRINKGKENVQRLFIPDDWFIYSNILEFKINSRPCSYHRCYNHPKQRHYIVEAFETSRNLQIGDQILFVVRLQKTYKSYFYNIIEMIRKYSNCEDAVDQIRYNKLYNKRYKKRHYWFGQYPTVYIETADPFRNIKQVDLWIKIPNVCNLKNIEILESTRCVLNQMDKLEILKSASKRSLFDRIFRRSISNKLRNLGINCDEFINEVENESRIGNFNSRINRCKELTTRSTPDFMKFKEEKNAKIYYKTIKNLRNSHRFYFNIGYNRKREFLFFIPVILALILGSISLTYIIGKIFNFNCLSFITNLKLWDMLFASITASLWPMIALNWSHNQTILQHEPQMLIYYLSIILFTLSTGIFAFLIP